jgi:nitrogen regulatory protein PII
MATLVPARRVTFVSEPDLEKIVLDEFAKLGVHGHTSAHVSGTGRHMLTEDVMPWSSAIRCEMVVAPEVANTIMDVLHGDRFRAYPLACWVDDTWVDSRDKF